MARAIGEAGIPLGVWARRPESLQVLEGVPHRVFESVGELAANCTVIGLCLRSDEDVEEVLFERSLLASLGPDGVVVNHGTGSPNRCPEWESRARGFGVHILDGPVSGGHHGAEEKSLTIMVGGDVASYRRCRPVFETFCRTMVHLGEAGSGQLAKLANNVMFAANLKIVAEFFELAEALALDSQGLAELVLTSSGRSFALETFLHHMRVELATHYQEMIEKDLMHFAEACRSRGIHTLPLEVDAAAGIVQLAEALHHHRAIGREAH
jgi:3-hydroxyisobutyrate dehydrogenase-like beta-hydroxyacid dehydrogenase